MIAYGSFLGYLGSNFTGGVHAVEDEDVSVTVITNMKGCSIGATDVVKSFSRATSL